MTLAAPTSTQLPQGRQGFPRIGTEAGGPNLLPAVQDAAERLRLELMPWQLHALSVITETAGSVWKYEQTATVVSRQNGKSTIIAPLVLMALERGERILHTAQVMRIPRHAFLRVVAALGKADAKVRLANGQEEIQHKSGGWYSVIAAQKGIRGYSIDRLIVDEVREFPDFDFMTAAEPTLAASPHPQTNFFSNAGHELSLVLNDLKARAGNDPRLAYLEWSAPPEAALDDQEGWKQANPALGYTDLTLDRLASIYASLQSAGRLSAWQTEHLCQWVLSMAPRLVSEPAWIAARRTLLPPDRPAMGISVAPDGTRASAALSWPQGDGSIGLMSLADVTLDPVDLDTFGAELRDNALKAGVQAVAYDPWTDQHLARYFPDAKPLQGPAFANASEQFVRDVETGRLHWEWADKISEDLPYTARKAMSGNTFIADRADPKRPITGILAAIRAVWLAGEPLQGPPSIW